MISPRTDTHPSPAVSLVLLALISLISFFAFAGEPDPNLMEARNLVTAREIVENGNWLVPTMNGEIRLTKPPLPTWLVAGVMQMTDNTGQLALLRLPNAIAATLLVFFLYGLGLTLSRDRLLALFAGGVFATTILAIEVGRTASWDIFCHAFMLGAIWCLVTGLRREDFRLPLAGFGLFLGLSFMSKGPVAFFAQLAPFLLSYLLVYRTGELRRRWPALLLALGICLVVSFWWPLFIYLKHPEALAAVTQQETGAWVNRHVKELWYYWNFPVFLGPWLLLFGVALVHPLLVREKKQTREERFFLLWLLFSLLLLSLIPEKKVRYLLPAAIPASLLTAAFIRTMIAAFREKTAAGFYRGILVIHTVLAGFLAFVLPLVLFYLLRVEHGTDKLLSPLLFLLAFWAIGLWLVLAYRGRRLFGVVAATVMLIATLTLAVTCHYRLLVYTNPGYTTMNRDVLANHPEITGVFALKGQPDMRRVWDLGRRIHRADDAAVQELLAAGKQVGLVSRGDPLPILADRFGQGTRREVLGTYDYRKSRPEKTRVFLSKLYRQPEDGEEEAAGR